MFQAAEARRGEDAPGHLAVLAIVAFGLICSGRQLTEIAHSLERSPRIFKAEVSEIETDGETAR
jgi:Sec-independent protein translocase protein TatA